MAPVHDRDPIPHAHRLDLVVGDVDGGRADAALELLELVAGRGPALGIQVRERLVQQEDVRIADERARKRDALPLTARELAWFALEIASRCRESTPPNRSSCAVRPSATFCAFSGKAMFCSTVMCG